MEDLSKNENINNNKHIISKYTHIPKDFIPLNLSVDIEISPSLNNRINNEKYEIDKLELVPDQAFSSLLNQYLEIEVYNNIYKITKYGTFFYKSG